MMDIPQGYKQTELGIIPDDWEVVAVCDVLDMPTKTTPTSSFNHEYYVGTENMYSGKRGVSLYIEEFYKLKYCSTVVYMVPRA